MMAPLKLLLQELLRPACVLLLLVVVSGTSIQPTTADYNGTKTRDGFVCPVQPRSRLGPDCRPFVVYNQLEWSRRPADEQSGLASRCACQIVNLDWGLAYDQHPSVQRVRHMILGLLGKPEYNNNNNNNNLGQQQVVVVQPTQVWSDTDVLERGISIYLSTRDFYAKRRLDENAWSWLKRADFQRDAHLRDLRYVCLQVAQDKFSYYQYLENLQRISPTLFFQALQMNDQIDLIYQASKGCKLFLLHRLQDFQLRPPLAGGDFYATKETALEPRELSALNELTAPRAPTLDENLRDASLELLNCDLWRSQQRSATSAAASSQHDERRPMMSQEELASECPMVVGQAETPVAWLDAHSQPEERSEAALKCGCQLLLHNATWHAMAADPSVSLMSKALTDYMQRHPLPGRGHAGGTGGTGSSSSPLLSTREYFGWFESVMAKFSSDKRVALKELVKFKRGDEDPTREINTKTSDEEQALEILRLGCNRVMFNHVKRGSAQHVLSTSSDIKLVQYLDNLQSISQDPLFVFHLALQDEALFKIYALSKVCQPFVR